MINLLVDVYENTSFEKVVARGRIVQFTSVHGIDQEGGGAEPPTVFAIYIDEDSREIKSEWIGCMKTVKM